MIRGKWLNTPVRDLTIQDALEAYENGVNFVCGDGKLERIVSDPYQNILNMLKEEGM